jgi:signal transduction histidine kinase
MHPAPAPQEPVRTLGLVRLIERAPDREALERMLAAYAVHPQGAGFANVVVLAWESGRRELEGRCKATGRLDGVTIEEALDEARRARPATPRPAAEAAVRSLISDPARFDGAPGEAWLRGAAVGPGGDNTPWAGAPAVGAALLGLEGEPEGLLVGEWARAAPPVDGAARLETLAALAELGLAALKRAGEARRRGRQVAGLVELARAPVSSSNLAEALRVGVEVAVQTCDARGSAVWLISGERLRLEATHGPALERDRLGRDLHALAEAACGASGPRVIQPVTEDPRVPPSAASELGAIVIAPLIAYGVTLGAIAAWHGAASEGEELPPLRDLAPVVGALADQLAACVDQARRFEVLRQARQREREGATRLRRAERLAALGDVAQRAGREARNPLASIGAFARRMPRAAGGDDPNREYLEVIVREAERLERLLAEQSEYLVPETPALRIESLNQVVQTALQQSAETLVRRRIRLLKRLAPDLPSLLLDPARIRRVIENLLEHALDGTHAGGRIRIESRRAGAHVVVEIAHDGPRVAGEALEQLFVPFASGHPGGPTVGLGVAQQVVRDHGGEIRVRSEGEWSSVVTLALPIRDNQDRRRATPDRRRQHADRRAAAPPS